MLEEEKRQAGEIETILRLAAAEDEQDDVDLDPDFCGDQLPAELASREKRLATIQEAKAGLASRGAHP